MNLQWTTTPFDSLGVQALHGILKLRVDVFVVEQHCPYAEVDGLDPLAHHVQGHDANGTLVAYARLLPPDAHGLPHIGRVVVHPDHRGRGLARALMEHSIRAVEQAHGSRRNAVSAQAHLVPFYSSLGYVATSPAYDWDGIPHVDMVLNG